MYSWRDYLDQRNAKDVGGKKVMNPVMGGDRVELTILRRHENTGAVLDPAIVYVTPEMRENEMARAATMKADAEKAYNDRMADADKLIENVNALFEDAAATE